MYLVLHSKYHSLSFPLIKFSTNGVSATRHELGRDITYLAGSVDWATPCADCVNDRSLCDCLWRRNDNRQYNF